MAAEYYVERTVRLPATPDRVWAALTQPELTRRWMFGCSVESDWKVGSPVNYTVEHEGEVVIVVSGKVIIYEPHTTLSLTIYQPEFADNPSKHTKATYQLTEQSGATEISYVQGPFHNRKEFKENEMSWEVLVVGLKEIFEHDN